MIKPPEILLVKSIFLFNTFYGSVYNTIWQIKLTRFSWQDLGGGQMGGIIIIIVIIIIIIIY